MSSMLETAEKEIIRNEVLKMCDMAGDGGASEQLLRAGLKRLGINVEPGELERQIRYLEDKRLAEVTRIGNERLNIRRNIVRITALGMDVLEGNAEVPGIAAE